MTLTHKVIGAIIIALCVGGIFLLSIEPKKLNEQAQAMPSSQENVIASSSSTSDARAPVKKIASLESIDIIKISQNIDQLRDVLKTYGIRPVMQRLVEESGGGGVVDCHQQAHLIGRTGYEIYKEKTFQLCDPSCHSGCYHGAMEWFLTEKGTKNLAENIDAVCKQFDTNFGYFECLHGVGHGVLAYDDYDVPSALKQCGKLKDSFSQTSCYGGVFMENIVTGQGLGVGKADHETPWVNKTDPLYPCNAIDQNYDIQYQCYQMQTSWMLTLAGYNFDTVAAQCLKAPENMVSVCFKSFGRDAAGNTLRNPEKIVNLCSKVPKENGYYDQCIIGAVNVIIDFWGPGLTHEASDLCKLLDDPSKQTCYSTTAGRLTGLFNDPEKRQAICKTFEPSFQTLCNL